MTPRIIDMKGADLSFHNVKIENFEGMGRVEFIGQCADMREDGQLNSTATDEPDNLIQVRGIDNGETPWIILRKNDRFYFPDHRTLQLRYQAKENGITYLLTGQIGDLQLKGKGA